MSTPSNTDDIIDSRDIIERLEELRNERQDLVDAVEEKQAAFNEAHADYEDADEHSDLAILQTALDAAEEAHAEAIEALAEWDTDNKAELDSLEALNSEGEDCASDWTHGETMIRESYFQDYAQELAEDIGAIPEGSKWPLTCIDWEQAARELQMDYSTINFDGVDYYVRS